MSVISELIRTEDNGTVSFGNYELEEKSKKSGFEHEGDLYKVKTFRELTRLEKNEMFVYESDPGTVVLNLAEMETGMTFEVEGIDDTQITLQVEPETDYQILINGSIRDVLKSNLGGKISFSIDLSEKAARIGIVKQ